MIGNSSDAEDLTREAFLQVFRRIDTFVANPHSPPGCIGVCKHCTDALAQEDRKGDTLGGQRHRR